MQGQTLCLSAPDDRMKYVMRFVDRIGREADKQGDYSNRLLGSQNRRHTRFNNIQECHALAIFQKETTRSVTLQRFFKKKYPEAPRSSNFPKRNTQERHAPGLHKKENIANMTRKRPVTLRRKSNDRKTPNLGAKKTPASTKYRKLVYICLKRPAYSKTDTCRFCF